MKQNFVTINGVNYPVVFNLLTMSNFEEITNKGFFEANLNKINERMAIVMAAVLAADKDTSLTIDIMRGKETLEDYKQIVEAYSVVMLLADDFFNIPEVEKEKEEKTDEGEGEDDKPKNSIPSTSCFNCSWAKSVSRGMNSITTCDGGR